MDGLIGNVDSTVRKHMSLPFQIEVCLEHPAEALAAQAAGATRIELNSALRLDGLTPTLAACRWLKAHCSLPLIAMLRPREGFFLEPVEQEILLEDARILLDAGVDGLAYGALDRHGELNVEYLQQVSELCGQRELVCHRAFDRLSDQQRGLEQLIECGVRRVLTSGGAATAEQGLSRLAELQHWARGRIEILPGSGIHADNARRIAQACGSRQLHGSFRANPDEIAAVCRSIESLR